MLRHVALVTLVLLLALAAFGCEPATPDVLLEDDTAVPHDESAEVAEDVDWEFLEGRWVCDTTLVDIDNEEFRFLGDKPSAQWECAVDGAVMQMQTVDHLYSGVLKGTADAWVYEGLAEFTDEDGATWTSTIVVRADQQDVDHFTAEMEGSIDSDIDGHLYTGTWDIAAERM